MFFFFKQKTAYEMRISDWSSDVCSSDLAMEARLERHQRLRLAAEQAREIGRAVHRVALRQIDQDRRDVARRRGKIDPTEDIGAVLTRGEPLGLLFRSGVGPGVDGGAGRVGIVGDVTRDSNAHNGSSPTPHKEEQ